jgi:hypothetical protein
MVGFAGARDLDDRRRRRLAQEAESAERRAPVKPAPPVVSSAPKFAASPIESIVRPQTWVNVLLVLLGLGMTGGAVFLGEWTSRNYPSAADSFGPRGLLLRSLGALYFLLAAQLAASIQWYRTRSRKDFNARYRIWHFVVPSLLAFGFCSATDAHLVFAAWGQARWQIAGAHAPLLLWMIPTGTILLAMVRLLHTEMRGTPAAAPTLWITILAAITNAAILLEAPLPIDPTVMEIAGRSATLLWPLGILLSLLFYARRVIYVTNEPCALPAVAKRSEEETSRSWLNWWRPRTDAERKPQAASGKSAAERPATQKPAGKPPAPTEDEVVSEAPAPVPASAARPQASASTPVSIARPSAPAGEPATRQTGGDDVVRRNDAAHDDEEDEESGYHGSRHHAMSKKERKKLRKMQQREQREDYD